MKKVLLQFEKCIQNMQELGSDEDFMFSKIFLKINYPNIGFKNIEVSVKQIAGGSFEEDPLEVYLPKEEKLKVNYEQLRDSVESYYRKLVGSQGRGIRIQNSSNVKMYNNTFVIPYEVEIDYSDENTTGW